RTNLPNAALCRACNPASRRFARSFQSRRAFRPWVFLAPRIVTVRGRRRSSVPREVEHLRTSRRTPTFTPFETRNSHPARAVFRPAHPVVRTTKWQGGGLAVSSCPVRPRPDGTARPLSLAGTARSAKNTRKRVVKSERQNVQQPGSRVARSSLQGASG